MRRYFMNKMQITQKKLIFADKKERNRELHTTINHDELPDHPHTLTLQHSL